jgi:hypothetical protein
MAATLEELEKRLAALEEEVIRLRQKVAPPIDETPAERGARLLREAKAGKAAFSAGAAKAFAEMGITGEPPSIEKFREMWKESGINPDDNLFSREIDAMNEE